MIKDDFEGTVVLEKIAALGKIDDFFEALDSDDVENAIEIMTMAKLDRETIAIVVEKMTEADGEH